jgi:hypothetical protein
MLFIAGIIASSLFRAKYIKGLVLPPVVIAIGAMPLKGND